MDAEYTGRKISECESLAMNVFAVLLLMMHMQ